MKILVNANPLVGLLSGVSRYVRQLYCEMERFPDVEVFYFDGYRVHRRMPDQAIPERWLKTKAKIQKLPGPVVFILMTLHGLNFERTLRRICRANRYDVYHETGSLPPALREVPIVHTVYDLSLRKFRHAHRLERVWHYALFFPRRIQYPSHFIAISDFVRREFQEVVPIPDDRFTVVHLAPSPFFSPRPKAIIDAVKVRFGISGDYLLFVGTLEPRKNLSLLMQALQRCRCRVPLVLAGWEGWGSKDWLTSIGGSELEKRIILTGYVDDETLACLYSGASAFVYPSVYEGFGLPILEAMACGCPVICSHAAAMPEAAGDAAVMIDPGNSAELADAIDRVLMDSSFRNRMIEKGFSQARMFTWRRAAEETYRVLAGVGGW